MHASFGTKTGYASRQPRTNGSNNMRFTNAVLDLCESVFNERLGHKNFSESLPLYLEKL